MAKKKLMIEEESVKIFFDNVDKNVIESEERLNEKISHLPTKDEFYEQTSKILKKLNDIETDMKVITNTVSVHSDDIEKLKKIHPRGKHIFEN